MCFIFLQTYRWYLQVYHDLAFIVFIFKNLGKVVTEHFWARTHILAAETCSKKKKADGRKETYFLLEGLFLLFLGSVTLPRTLDILSDLVPTWNSPLSLVWHLEDQWPQGHIWRGLCWLQELPSSREHHWSSWGWILSCAHRRHRSSPSPVKERFLPVSKAQATWQMHPKK